MADVLGSSKPSIRVDSHILERVSHSPIQQILSFLNLSIDDVVDDPIARSAVHLHWRVYHLVNRRCAAVDAERMRDRRLRGESIITDDEEDALARSIKHT